MLKQYDSNELTRFAGRLLEQATMIVVMWSIFGLLIAAVVYALTEIGMFGGSGPGRMVLMLMIFVVCYAVGRERGLQLRVQAQTLLCQVAIEMGVRQNAIASMRIAELLAPANRGPATQAQPTQPQAPQHNDGWTMGR